MKKVYTVIYLIGEERGKVNMSLSPSVNAEATIARAIGVRNKLKVTGEKDIILLKVRENPKAISYEHDWKLIGSNFVCKDCGIVGKRKNVFSKIQPVRTDPKFKNCRWKVR